MTKKAANLRHCLFLRHCLKGRNQQFPLSLYPSSPTTFYHRHYTIFFPFCQAFFWACVPALGNSRNRSLRSLCTHKAACNPRSEKSRGEQKRKVSPAFSKAAVSKGSGCPVDTSQPQAEKRRPSRQAQPQAEKRRPSRQARLSALVAVRRRRNTPDTIPRAGG